MKLEKQPMMRHLVGTFFAMAAVAGQGAWAQTSPVVVELYTSQGCSSCPPADAFIADLAVDPNVIALSLHVDYWDYIGWKDTFADPQYTKRQRAYARAEGSRTVYTPQMIVGGVDRLVGNEPLQVVDSIRRHMMTAAPVQLSAMRKGDQIVIRALADPPLDMPAFVQIVRYLPEAKVMIERGENAGREVTYRNIVTDWQMVGQWDGTSPFDLVAEVAGSEPVVVIIQSEGPAEVLAAARLP